MNSIYDQFKTSFVSGVFSLAGRTWWKYVVVTLIQTIITFMAALPLLLSVLNWEAFNGIIDDPEGWSKQIESNPEVLLKFLGPEPNFSSLIVGVALFVVVLTLVQAWTMHVFFRLNQDEIANGNSDLAEAFSSSFSGPLLRLLGMALIFSVMSVFVVGAIVASGALISGWLAFLLVFVGIIFLLRFVLTYPSIVHANLSIGESISTSFSIIDWRRASLLFLGIIASFISLIVASLFLGVLSFVLLLIPFLGVIVYYAINLVINGFVNALMFGALSGLYYRYTEENPGGVQSDDLSKHLMDYES